MSDKKTKKSLNKGFAWTAVDRFSNIVIQFILGIAIVRLITPEEYGVLGISILTLTSQNNFKGLELG